MSSLIGRFPKQTPPLVSLVVATLVGEQAIKWTPKPDQNGAELAQYPKGFTLRGDHTIARYLARKHSSLGLYSDDLLRSCDIDQWVDLALTDFVDAKKVDDAIKHLNVYLTMRTYLSGYTLTLADIAVWGALKSYSRPLDNIEHVARWVNHLDSMEAFVTVLKKYLPSAIAATSASTSGPAAPKVKYLELPGATEGKVVTRFPPEPSGYLHMGHVKAALLNNYYARLYKGKLILRFDDTNPTKESVEFVDMITKDLATLEIVPDEITYSSDKFDKCIELAEYMINKGLAYVDQTPGEEMKVMRLNMIESKYRSQTVEENMKLWEEMKKGTPEGMKSVLRAKVNMQSKNGCMRDPSIYRVVLTPHHRTGSKYKVYPIYDFVCPIVDSLEGVTHALRSNEYHDRDEQYKWFLDALPLTHKPCIQDFSRLNFMYTLLSKRKLQWFVDKGYVEGWNSPAFPTVQGILRRGLTVPALREFILAQGSSKRENMQGMEKLWALNKQAIDRVIPRHTAVANEGKVILTLSNGPKEVEYKSVPKHKDNESLGKKAVAYFNKVYLEQEDAKVIKVNEEVTLKDWGNAIIRTINKDNDGNVTSLEGELHLAGDFKTTEWKLTWLAVVDDVVPVKLREYDYLITKTKLDKDDDFHQFINPHIFVETDAVGDQGLRLLRKGDRLQLERRGYFIVDSPYLALDSATGGANAPLVLIMIPDGRQTTQSHLASKVTLKGTSGGQPKPAPAPAPAKN